MYNGPNIVTNGLALYLDAANRNSYVSGSTIMRDISGNLYSGSLLNGILFDSSSIQSINFDGINDYSILNMPPINTPPLTVEVWVKINSDYSNQAIWAQTTSDTNNIRTLSFISESMNRFTWQVRGVNTGLTALTTSSIVELDKWYNIVATSINNSTHSIYLNGVLQNTTLFNTSTVSSTKVRIGTYDRDVFTNWLRGSISNIRIYSIALTPQEVLQNYNALKGRFNLD